MTWTKTLLQIDPSAVSVNRTALDLTVSDNSIIVDQAGINWGTSEIEAYFANEQRWGSSIVSYRVPNREISIPLHLSETGRQNLQKKVGLLQREGGVLMRKKYGGDPLYADIETATLTVPDVYGETQGLEVNAQLNLSCLPDFYGDQIILDDISVTGEYAGKLQLSSSDAIIKGDYPGRAEISLVESSGNDKYGMLWGFRARHYDSASSAKLIWAAATSLTAASGATQAATLSGGHGNQVITHPTVTNANWIDIASISGSHVGSYQVWARIYTGGPLPVYVRFGWNLGDSSHGMITPAAPVVLSADNGYATSKFYMVNLGQIRLDLMPDLQKWVGVLQAVSTTTVSFSVDEIILQPLDEASGMITGHTTSDYSNPACMGSGRLTLSWSGAVRNVAGNSGQNYTPMVPLGDLVRIPPSGIENRPVEVLLRPSRGDLGTMEDNNITDTATVNVAYRPCYVLRP